MCLQQWCESYVGNDIKIGGTDSPSKYVCSHNCTWSKYAKLKESFTLSKLYVY